MVFGGDYPDYAESRGRTRYAVVSGLAAAAFEPVREDALGYFDLATVSPEWARHGQQKVPFELFRIGDRHAVLLWLDENALVFFTIDLDARLLHPGEYAWTRNLVVASGFGLALHGDMQRDIPPFLDLIAVRLTFARVRQHLMREFLPLDQGVPALQSRPRSRPPGLRTAVRAWWTGVWESVRDAEPLRPCPGVRLKASAGSSPCPTSTTPTSPSPSSVRWAKSRHRSSPTSDGRLGRPNRAIPIGSSDAIVPPSGDRTAGMSRRRRR